MISNFCFDLVFGSTSDEQLTLILHDANVYFFLSSKIHNRLAILLIIRAAEKKGKQGFFNEPTRTTLHRSELNEVAQTSLKLFSVSHGTVE